MEKLIKKFKKIDKTKRIVILFITISFVFIAGFSVYNGITGNYTKENTAQIKQIENNKEKDTKKNTKQTKESTQKEDTLQQEESISQEETNHQENTVEEGKKETTNESSITDTQNDKEESENLNDDKEEAQETNQITNENNTIDNTNTDNSSNIQEETKVTVNVKVLGIESSTIMNGSLKLDEGETAYSALKQLADQKGISISGSKIYVSGIGDLHEKQYGPMSGWMYSVNGVAPNKAACYYNLNDGDSVVWYYVNYK